MKQRKWNGLLTLFSLIGGLLGFLIGEWVLNQWEGKLHETLLMGIYFGQFALVVGLCCLIAEMISPQLNGHNWKLRYAGDGWKLLVPGTLVMLFVGGLVFQWFYGISFGKKEAPQNYVLLLDMSESMKQTDPNKLSNQAAQSLIRRMDDSTRVGLYTFNEAPQLIFPLTKLDNSSVKEQLASKVSGIAEPYGKTDIGHVLTAVMDQLRNQGDAGSQTTMILISDGISDMNNAKVLAPYVQNGVKIQTVGMIDASEPKGNALLQQIAEGTGGTFYDVKRADGIAGAFDQIYASGQPNHLLNERTGAAAADGYHGWLRVLFLMLIGTLIGLSLGIVFDNRYLAKSFAIGGTAAGLIAGWILEAGLPGADYPSFYRALADLTLAVVLSLSTLAVAVHQDTSGSAALRGGSGRTLLSGRENDRFGRRGDGPAGKRFR
ncbi:VWA domain-containing protein [Paenibacillus sp. TAB 01]|uniref:vWA domain-containing protein n=1 Tax=Paenibacillus sp. TAB 01 TaxID=3368988 RepID=UPI00375158BD